MMKTPSGFIPVTAILALALASNPLPAQTGADQTPTDQTTATPAAQAAPEIPHTPGSDIRIIRLSQVQGKTELDRNTDHGFEAAFTNLPIVQNARLRTEDGVAEVEFEDNSTLRLTPNSLVTFPELRLSPTGATRSTVQVLQGTVYISLANTRANQFTVNVGSEQLTLSPGSHIELTSGSPARLAVFEGSVDLQRSSGLVTVGKKKELLFDPADQAAPTLLTKVEKSAFDDWDKNSANYHKSVGNAAFGNSFGSSDLGYYGSFADLPGCGSMWRPYFTSAAWNPFSNGLWAWYPGAGYSWVSPYPWAWTPFHSGSWQQCGAGGWGWRPGGNWVGLANSSKLPNGIKGSPRPPSPPSPGRPTVVPVNTRPLSVSTLRSSETFVFSKDSAGLGVPRSTFGDLKAASVGVARHGEAAAAVATEPGLVTLRPGASGSIAASTHYSHIVAAQPSTSTSNPYVGSYQPTSSLNSSNPAPSVHTSSPSPSPASTAPSRK